MKPWLIRSSRVLLLSVVFFALTALASTAFAMPYKVGNQGSTIKRLQKNLKSYGYYTSTLNGKFTTTMKKSVVTFQKANGLEADGVIDQKTYDRIVGGKAVTYKQYINALADAQCVPGGKGDQVLKLKKRLYTLKYYSGAKNDEYDDKTKTAVALFQKYHDLKETGTADQQTRDLLMSSRAVSKTQYEKSLTKALKYGQKDVGVKIVKQQLKALGYFSGTVNTKFDKALKTAVTTFQSANGIKASGKACTATRKKLNAGTGITYQAYQESLKTKALKPGNSGAAVKLLQQRLKELGYYTKTVNSKYDANTKKAVSKFQEYNKLKVTGTADAETRKVMNASDAITVDDVKGPKTLKKGNSGADVKRLQTRLKELGYYTGSVDGKYDNAVVTAVKMFQRVHGYQETGTAYAEQRKVMESAKAISKAEYLESERKRKVEIVVKAALDQMGKPYVWGKSGPDAFDCTGLTCYAYSRVGISLKRSAYDQGYKDGKRITNMKELRRGDIVIFNTVETDSDLSDHAGIFLGDGTFVHASSAGGKVIVSSMKSGYYNRVFSWGLDVW